MRPKSEVIRLPSRFLSPMSNYNFVVLMTVASSAIEDSYLKWANRMRIPPKVERHNLDLDWPDTPMGKKPPALSQGATISEFNRKEAAPAHTSNSNCPINCQKQTLKVPYSSTSRFWMLSISTSMIKLYDA